MTKAYVRGNYFYLEHQNSVYEGLAKEVLVKRQTPTSDVFYFKNLNNWTDIGVSIGDLQDEAGNAYTLSSFVDFYEQNTGKSSGGGSGEGLQLEINANKLEIKDKKGNVVDSVDLSNFQDHYFTETEHAVVLHLKDEHSKKKIHIEPTGRLIIERDDVSAGFMALVMNHSGDATTITFNHFVKVFEFNRKKKEITTDSEIFLDYLESALLTVTESGGIKFLNIHILGGVSLKMVQDEIDKKLLEERTRPIFSGATIYQDIFDARDAGVAVKAGSAAYNDTTYTASNKWNERAIIQFGSNNEADGNGMLVTMPTDKNVLWIRFLGDRWNVVKVNDDKGKQFGLWSAGYRDNNAITPDGAAEDSVTDIHQWIPINVKGHSGKLYVISKASTNNDFWCSGIAWSDNLLDLTWLSAIAFHWAINGGDSTAWHSSQWNNDNLGQLAPGTFKTLKVPVAENGQDKLLFINLHGTPSNEGGHVAVHVNGTKLDTRFSEQWTNPFFRQRMSNMYNHMFAVKVPQNLIPSGATFLDVQIDLRSPNTSIMYYREAGTLNL